MVAVKVILDSRDEVLPAALDRIVDEFGQLRRRALCAELLGTPTLLYDLYRLGRACGRADAALLRLARQLGPDLRIAPCA